MHKIFYSSVKNLFFYKNILVQHWSKATTLQKFLFILSFGLFSFSIAIGLITRIIPVFQDSEYSGDMARDLYVYQEMWKGNFPTLGPASSVGLFNLPPQYYYLIWPFTIFGPQTWWPVLSSGIFSLGSIVLIAILIYKLLSNIKFEFRLFLSALSAFWWSLITVDIILANRAWNPSPVNFFLLALILVWDHIWHTARLNQKQWKLWAFYGFLFSMLLGMHGSTLIVMPVFFIGSLIVFYLFHKQWQGQLVSIFTATILMIPYFIGEIQKNWSNTSLFFHTILGESGKNSLWSLLDRVIFTFEENAKLVYFLNPWLLEFSIIFLIIVMTSSFLFFKGNFLMYYSLLILYGIFITSAASFQGYLTFYYIIILWSMPMIFTLTTLAYFPYSWRPTKTILISLTIIGISLSLFSNGQNSKTYLSSKYGSVRQVNTKDMETTLSQFPLNSRVCNQNNYSVSINIYGYIDQYITKRGIIWENGYDNQCKNSDFYLLRTVEPNYSVFDDTTSPKVRIHQFYNFFYNPLKYNNTVISSDWELWREVGQHKIYKRLSSLVAKKVYGD